MTADGPHFQTYASPDGEALRLHVFAPSGGRSEAPRSVYLFFHGGGFAGGSPELGYDLAAAIAGTGRVAICVQYRMASATDRGPKLDALVGDAKASIRFVRAHADDLGVSTDRVVAGGHSAGGTLAAATALVPGLEMGEDLDQDSVPNAFLPWSAALILSSNGMMDVFAPEGSTVEAVSPFHHLRPGLPPSVLLHGEADGLVPLATSEAFVAKAEQMGNSSELVSIPGADHFFNDPRHREPLIAETIAALSRLGF